jgi:16S rRNA (guanine1207-N2)-methyltransferase
MESFGTSELRRRWWTWSGPAGLAKLAGVTSHYFDVDPTVPMEPAEVGLSVDGQDLTLTSARGVFGRQRVDVGTNILIQYGPRPPETGDILDLGCGYGPIAVALALRAPQARIWAVDVNRRAIGLVKANAARLGLANICTAEADQLPGDVRFTAIYSNPPIKIGKDTLHELLGQWLPRLLPGGHAYLVVKRSMGSDTLERWLTESGWPAQRLRSKTGYRILEVSAPSVDA